MYFIPELKSTVKCEKFKIKGCTFDFPSNIDKRVVNLANKVEKGATKVTVSVIEADKCEYKMKLSEHEVIINASSQQAVFYAIQTLRQVIKNGYCDICEISDSPDFETRGIYYDVTRGRIPTLEALKELVDNLAYTKINMLQLYVEHVFPFKEYDGIYQRTGYLTPEEIKELDEYCYQNFIEFVPSLSCFGHLYELLQYTDYKRLCELEEYTPTSVDWNERMRHHTIDPTNPESIEVIKSLINQYAPLFRSNKFNICCDETFDLCQGKNAGKDKGRLYVDFVKKIIAHIRSLGKIAMMWGDIIHQHPEFIEEIDDSTIFLNWGYSADPYTKMIYDTAEKGKMQYVCPGITNWSSLIEFVHVSEPNITKMAQCGFECGAKGLLTTCWGDHGHISSMYACMHGLLFGAEKGWNTNSDTSDFGKKLDLLYFGYDGAYALYEKISKAHLDRYWWHLLAYYCVDKYGEESIMKSSYKPDPDVLTRCFYDCEDTIPYLMATTWENEKARKALLVTAKGSEYMIAMLMSKLYGEKFGVNIKDVEEWLAEYKEVYLQESKMGELVQYIKIMYYLAEKYLKQVKD
ncbi:MAG: family 20 glycosylhydrolase [Clostridia bacterium]|nr:family 20 glycosylhydrolase [Clostridia bacterium]